MSKINWLEHLSGNGVYSLREAQNSLLQVLLNEFSLERNGYGFTLNVSFQESDTAIRRREAKKYVESKMSGYSDKVNAMQAQIDAVFSGKVHLYRHTDTNFAFRYASGGTLPIVELDSTWYYCLFYRDVHPIGWNIANGACDSIPELLDPKITIERELREELIILALYADEPLDYVFTWVGEYGVCVPEFKYARRLANTFLADELNINRDFQKELLKVDWSTPGPDTLRIKYNGQDTKVLQGFYLNINAKDFGIEFDRIASIRLPQGVVLLDGEINDNRLLNEPVGLFEIGKTQKAVYEGSTEFLPDRLFYSAARELNSPPPSAEDFRKKFIREEFLERLLRIGVRNQESIEKWESLPLSDCFDLCPVTRSIIWRHIRATRPRVFLSYSRKDSSFAEEIERDLKSRNIEVWRDARDLQLTIPIDISIERAIEESSHLLLLASQNSVSSEFVRDEVQYANNLQKPKIALMLEPCQLPLPAGRWNSIHFQHRYKEALDELMHALFLKRNE